MGALAIRPPLLLRPDSTLQVSQILALCNENNHPAATQGGMTGLVSSAAPLEGEIALMETLQQALDPRGILNPGRIIK
ncbi:MAG TPA: hypothetical protein DEF79_03300 [Gammaproteobacteria bacterium]|nr:hypothetical protein [Gammaproteobacteria bacterium]|tara:strand:- start:6250 stop:6483 length:234 start_codon:yes stop_codon:yes gene_type:complete